jgi:hypothetical protein
MKKILFISILASMVACSNQSKSVKLHPDTCYTQIIFKNIYSGQKPFPPVATTAVRIIKDTPTIDGDHVTHRLDTMYFVGYSKPIPDPTDITHKKNLKSVVDGTDSVTFSFYPVPPAYILQDFNKTEPFTNIPAPQSTITHTDTTHPRQGK